MIFKYEIFLYTLNRYNKIFDLNSRDKKMIFKYEITALTQRQQNRHSTQHTAHSTAHSITAITG